MRMGPRENYPKLVAFGNPLLDIIVEERFSGDVVDKYKLDRNIAQENDTIANGLYADVTSLAGTRVCPGGCGPNTVRVFQWLTQQQHTAALMGGVGRDQGGKIFQKFLSNAGVLTCLSQSDLPTGHCIAMVEGAERTLVANLGAANHYTPEDLNSQENSSVLHHSQAIYIEGYFLAHSYCVSRLVAEQAKAHNKIFVFNLCGEYVCEDAEYVRNVVSLLPYIDYLFGNRSEFQVFVKTAAENGIQDLFLQKLEPLLTSDPVQNEIVGEVTVRQQVRQDDDHILTAIVTEGSEHVRCHLVSRHSCSTIVYPVPSLPVPGIKDTIGAGDSLIAGFLYVLLEGGNQSECVQNAIWTAQRIIQEVGSTLPAGNVSESLPWHSRKLRETKKMRVLPGGNGTELGKRAKIETPVTRDTWGETPETAPATTVQIVS